jgi:protein O-GlcNAc transferase
VELRRPRQGQQIVLTFIDRTGSRKLIDQEDYFKTVKEQFPHVTVQMIDFASIPFQEQLRIVQGSDILVGVHGAGLTHGIFLPSGSVMVEILPPGLNHKGFRNLASLLGHFYFSGHATKPAKTLKRDDWHNSDVNLEHDKFMDLMNVAIKALYNRGERNYDVI